MAEWVIYGVYLVFALGGASLYLMLPKKGETRLSAGAIIGGCALLGMVFLFVQSFADSPKLPFYILAVLAVGGTGRVITHTRPVYSAMYFVMVIIAVAGMCLLMAAEFLAIALVLIYAGAILVTYVFVIMLAQGEDKPVYDYYAREPLLSVCTAVILMAAVSGQALTALDLKIAVDQSTAPSGDAMARLAALSQDAPDASTAQTGAVASEGDSRTSSVSQIEDIGAQMITRYVVALEVGALLLLVAMVGAVAISRKRVPTEAGAGTHEQVEPPGRKVAPF